MNCHQEDCIAFRGGTFCNGLGMAKPLHYLQAEQILAAHKHREFVIDFINRAYRDCDPKPNKKLLLLCRT